MWCSRLFVTPKNVCERTVSFSYDTIALPPSVAILHRPSRARSLCVSFVLVGSAAVLSTVSGSARTRSGWSRVRTRSPDVPVYALWDGGYDSLTFLVAEPLHFPFPTALFIFYYLFSVGSVVTGDLVGGYFEADTSGIRVQWIAIGACFLFGGLLFFEPVVEAFAYTPMTPFVEVGVGLLALLYGGVFLAIDRIVTRYRT